MICRSLLAGENYFHVPLSSGKPQRSPASRLLRLNVWGGFSLTRNIRNGVRAPAHNQKLATAPD